MIVYCTGIIIKMTMTSCYVAYLLVVAVGREIVDSLLPLASPNLDIIVKTDKDFVRLTLPLQWKEHEMTRSSIIQAELLFAPVWACVGLHQAIHL